MAAIADHFETQDKRASREMQIQTITHEKKDFRAPEGGDEEHLKDVPKDRRHTTFVSTFKPGIRGLRVRDTNSYFICMYVYDIIYTYIGCVNILQQDEHSS